MKFLNLTFLLSLFLLLLSLTSCSTFIDSIQKDLSREDRLSRDDEDEDSSPDQFDQYRKNTKRRTSSVFNKPGRQRNDEVTTDNQKIVSPQTKRKYQDERVALKRVTASDLTDQGNDGSLWGGADPNAFLFSTSKNKTSGDIIRINVLAKLRNEITLELKRAFPESALDKNDTPPPPATTPATPAAAAAGATPGAPPVETDRISSVVVEEVNREHLLIKGRKTVLFKNRKRMVEVQALVSRKDIADDDTVNSDSIIESNIAIVR